MKSTLKNRALNEQLSDICTQCGMCCDGTLFNHAKIIDDADAVAVEGLGLTILTKEDSIRYFPQPCACFKSCCTVYERRPKVCISFFCAPLHEARKGVISVDKAMGIIQNALVLRREVLSIAAEIEEFKNFGVLELFQAMHPQPSDTLKKHPTLLIKIAAARVVLNKMLRHAK